MLPCRLFPRMRRNLLHVRYTGIIEEAKTLGIVSGYTDLRTAYEGQPNHLVPLFPGDVYELTVQVICDIRNQVMSSKVNNERGRREGQEVSCFFVCRLHICFFGPHVVGAPQDSRKQHCLIDAYIYLSFLFYEQQRETARRSAAAATASSAPTLSGRGAGNDRTEEGQPACKVGCAFSSWGYLPNLHQNNLFRFARCRYCFCCTPENQA